MARPHKAAAALAIGLPAVLLGVLSLHATVASALALPQDATIERLRRRAPIAPAQARALADASLRAARWFEPARHRSEAAAALIALSADRPEAFGEAETHVRAALRAAPAAPYDWARLAWLRAQARDFAGARAAWDMSVLTGRYVPALMAPRTLLAIRLLPLGDAAFERAATAQIRLFARAMPGALAQVTREAGAEPVVRAALSEDAEALAAFNRETQRIALGARRRVQEPGR